MKGIKLITLLLFSSYLIAQDEDAEVILGKESADHLWPVDNGYALLFGSEKMMSKDIEDDGEYIMLESIVYPSFDTPKRISLLTNNQNNLYRLALTSLKKKKINKIRIKDTVTVYKKLDPGHVMSLNWIFEQVLIETKYSRYNKYKLGLDGTIYQFFVDGEKYGMMFGETWSPREGILPKVLVDVSMLLCEYIEENISENDLTTKINVLKETVKKIKAK